ncbi:hypothetical protein COCON_G00185920 [Conger conger]|uniref:MAC-inhibitory protein n=1 Tax=Conger conger TaxID=82655 RepID=A0A9Q1D2N3_CONCO|nr:hypothetical protein COCON_G00185920 [Conger conger]
MKEVWSRIKIVSWKNGSLRYTSQLIFGRRSKVFEKETNMTAKMNTSLIIGLGFFFATFSLGSTLRCYKCSGFKSCSAVQDCGRQDACLTLKEKGGKTIRQCIKSSACDSALLNVIFPGHGFTFNCCTSNLCNSSPAILINRSFLGLLALFVIFWCYLI